MKKTTVKIISLIMSVMMIFSVSYVALAAETQECNTCPSIVIPGVFQSDVRYYDENGNEKLNSKGEAYKAPFFLESTGDIVKLALKDALLPISKMLITQKDKDDRAAKAVAKVLGEVLAGRVISDENGNVIYGVKAVKYNTSLANLSEYDREYALNQIPLRDYAAKVGVDHLYFYSYMSFGNIKACAEELYQLIQTAKRETGHSKVNIVPISQGGTIANALMQLYRDKGLNYEDDINRVCYIVPAADETVLLGDIFHYGLIDDDENLYGTMLPSLIDGDDQWLAYLVNLLLRIMPNANVNKILDEAVDTLINDYIGNSTCMWALLPSKDYPDCRDKYLAGDGKKFIREQTDWYYNAEVNSRKYILESQKNGVEFFDIADYNEQLYQICDSWNQLNGDGIIQLDSTSFGATSAPVGQTLAENYVQQNTYCTDPEHHNHIDKDRIVDASTGVLCESTFYFKDQNHEKTAKNDVIIRLATHILIDETFKNVYSDPAYPQFNFARNSIDFVNRLQKFADFDTSKLSEEDAKEFKEAYAEAVVAAQSTCMPTAEFNVAKDRFNAVANKILNPNQKNKSSKLTDFFIALLTKFFKTLSDIALKNFGGKGYSEWFGAIVEKIGSRIPTLY